MISYLAILLIAIFLLFVSVGLFKRKLYSPSVLFLAGYILSICLAIVGMETWNTEKELSLKTMAIVTITMTSFCVGDVVGSLIKIKDVKNTKKDKIKYPSVILAIITVLLFVVTTFLTIRDLNNICSTLGCDATTVLEKMRFYHDNSGLFVANGVSYSQVTNRFFQVSSIVTVFYIYLFFSRGNEKTEKTKRIFPLTMIIAGASIAFIRNGRSGIMSVICSTIVMYIIVKSKQKNFSHLNIVKKIIPITLAILAMFYISLSMMGKTTQRSATEYVSAYLGCSIPSLNIALREDISQNAETPLDNSMYGLRSYASKLGFTVNNKERSLPFILVGNFHTNVYTSAFRLYDDFGIIMAELFILLSGLCFSVMCKMSDSKKNQKYTIFYLLMASRLIDMCRDETFYTLVLSPSTIISIVLIIIISIAFERMGQEKCEKRK